MNQMLYYIIRYLKPNPLNFGVVTIPPLVADVAKKLGSLMVKSTKNQFFKALYNNLVERFPNTEILTNLSIFSFFVQCTSVLLNLHFFFPYFDHDAFMHHALHSLDAPVWRNFFIYRG